MEPLKQFYLGLPPAIRARVPVGLEAWAWRRLEARRAADPARALETRLWGGFSQSAREGLVALAEDPAADPRQRGEAALALAGWHAVAGDDAAALAQAVAARTLCPALARDRRTVMLEALFLCRLGRGAGAEALLDARLSGRADASVLLMRANARGAAAPRDEAGLLAALNALLARHRLAPLARRDPSRPLGLDNLAAAREPAPVAGPLVSVIVPLFDAAATVATALASLTAQSWRDLEILVVDDASTDAGPAIVAEIARADPRIRLLRQPTNRGGYAARNRALAEAAGAFVTAHDADDWSHPEKIARQMAALAHGPYSLSSWVRTGDDLLFHGPSRPSRNLVGFNHSSALLPTDLVRRLGGWDSVRVAADTELIRRVERALGNPPEAWRGRRALPDCPLAFGRLSPGSLTRGAAVHILTNLHGLRREYLEAAEAWHEAAVPRLALAARLDAAPPFFPAPPVLRADRGAGPPLDLLLVGDFNLVGGAFHSAMHMLRAARAAGLACGLLQYRCFELNVALPLAPAVRREALAREVRIVAPGERLAAASVVVSYPVPLAHAMDRFPEVEHARLALVVNQLAARDREGRDVAYDPARVRANLAGQLGGEGTWVPISPRVAAAMAADPRYPPPWPEPWTPLADPAALAAPPVPWRGGSRARPVLGRHGRDHPLKWPRDPAMLMAAYCAGRPCETRFLGGARHARARLRRWPRNWRVAGFGGDVRGFLAELDFFLHFPDPDYLEEFGRAPMEAMAAGVPVILPPEFAPTFGEAALYAAPEAVWPTVAALWADRAAWEARAAAGRAFVRAHCGYDAFPGRLARLPGGAG